MPTTTTATTSAASTATRLHRIEVRRLPGMPDPQADRVLRELEAMWATHLPKRVQTAAVYLVEASLDDAQLHRLADELLADPVTETAVLGASLASDAVVVEVHPQAGVMDPDAESVETAIRAVLNVESRVSTGRRYEFHGIAAEEARQIAVRLLANPLIHDIHVGSHHPRALPAGHARSWSPIDVPLRDLDDAALQKLSREAHLFLSLAEMKAIQQTYQSLGREPREIELETLAQTWSEHCVHKTLKSTVVYREHGDDPSGSLIEKMKGRAGHDANADGSITIHNLLKSTVAAATRELMLDGIDWCLSVFVDNAGVIAFDDEQAICIKVETHNHPSALEPYGGAATGVGGVIRDIIGTGLGAKPIANTDIFCVAHPDHFPAEGANGVTGRALPQGCLHPRRILTQVVAGVRDYGNRMGIPTLNGALWFDDNYVGNPLVFCGCVGVMPRDMVHGNPKEGDLIIALGGRTGRDGIHGATFSSAELTDTHADEFSHAVQIGNAVTEKKVLDAILAARDHESGCFYSAITDCGAGGFSSAVGEMGEKLGAEVHLDRAPLKYAGLSPTEIWISEAQERMVLAVPRTHLDALRALCATHEVELCELGTFGTKDRQLILCYEGVEFGRMAMTLLHEGIPMPTREATWTPPPGMVRAAADHDGQATQPAIEEALLALLAHPNIASKHWIIRQYDHEVQGGSVVKPLVGPYEIGPSDAAVVVPASSPRGSATRGVAIANGLATGLAGDPYVMALAAVDECVRNLVCVGADPSRIAILDNFCWPGCDDPQRMAGLVRAAEGCYDAAKAYRTPFVSGKDSLNNQFTAEHGTTIRIPPTLLISGVGIVEDVTKCVTMDAKRAGNVIVMIGERSDACGGSHYAALFPDAANPSRPIVDLNICPQTARSVAQCIADGLVESAHDVGDGGVLCALAEMCIAGGLGASVEMGLSHDEAFSEAPGRYILEVQPGRLVALRKKINDDQMTVLGTFTGESRIRIAGGAVVTIADARSAWRSTLDW